MSTHGGHALGLDVAQRILLLRRDDERTVDFARRIGLSPQVLYNYAAELNGASLEAVAIVASRTNVNPRWLLTGEGAREVDVAAEVEPYQHGVRELSVKILRLLDQLGRDCGLGGISELLDEALGEGASVPARRG